MFELDERTFHYLDSQQTCTATDSNEELEEKQKLPHEFLLVSASLPVPLGVCFLSRVLSGGSRPMSEWPRTLVVRANTDQKGKKKQNKTEEMNQLGNPILHTTKLMSQDTDERKN